MAQVQTRITNPYMPNGSVELTNSPTPLYAPGELGAVFSDQSGGGVYRRVVLDSGATSATTVGAVKAGQLAFWKDRANFIVTNDKIQCDLGATASINRVAGIFQLAVSTAPNTTGTDGNPVQYVTDLVVQKRDFPVQATGTIVAGAVMIADTTAAQARGICVASVVTAPISQVIGVCKTTVIASNGTTPVDVSIGFGE